MTDKVTVWMYQREGDLTSIVYIGDNVEINNYGCVIITNNREFVVAYNSGAWSRIERIENAN